MGLGTRETRYAKAHQVARRPPARLGIEGDGVAAKLRPGAGIAGDGCFPSTGRFWWCIPWVALITRTDGLLD